MAPRLKQRLLEERDRLVQELEALKRQAAGIEIAISRIERVLEKDGENEKDEAR